MLFFIVKHIVLFTN